MLGHGVAAALVCLRSTPPRVGAVLLTEDGEISYTDCAPPVELLAQFKPRNDNQIASLEMLAIAYGMGCTPGGVCLRWLVLFSGQACRRSKASCEDVGSLCIRTTR